MKAAIDELRGFRLAVLTGGSSGIGKRFISTILEGNPEVRVCNLSRTSPERFPGLEHIPCDLAEPVGRGFVFARVAEWAATSVDAGKMLLINNAGFGIIGAFPEPKVRQHVEMIEVNIAAMVELTGVVLPELRRRGGAIINVASTAAFQPMPDMQTYAATKAFVVNWSVALARELRGSGVKVQALCPGPTRTDFGRRAGFDGTITPGMSHDVDRVVATSFRALQRDRVVAVPGIQNFMLAWIARRMPLRMAAALAQVALGRTGAGKARSTDA